MTAEAQPFQCTFEGCYERFDSLEKLRKHKKKRIDHDYCARCDLEFEDWDAWVKHRGDIDDKAHGYTCGRCGIESICLEAKNSHITLMHPVSQEVKCIPCGKVFTRPSALIRHFEYHDCQVVSCDEFLGHVQHKFLIKAYLENPSALSNITREQWDEAARDTDAGGGVSVRDWFGRDQNTMDRDDGNVDLALAEALEPINVGEEAHIEAGMQRFPPLISIKSPINSDSRKNGGITTSFQQLADPWAPHVNSKTKNIVNQTQKDIWTSGVGPSKVPLQTAETKSHDVAVQEAEANKDNILHHQFWNPTSKEFSAERFYHPVLEQYRCPVPTCSNHTKTANDLANHIRKTHQLIQIECPQCHRVFARCHQLVAHAETETSQRCRLTHTDHFQRTMDEFTGGFVAADRAPRPDRPSLEYLCFKGATPSTWRRQQQQKQWRQRRPSMQDR